ncbi:MAG: exo-alpha-sialidase [Roseovarius sp.]|nr:exo-alpha-sialidase [Roseovarius sp.]
MAGTQLLIVALTLMSVGLSGYALWHDRPLDWRFATPDLSPPGDAPVFERVLDYTAPEGQAHSPGIVVDDAGFAVLWFEGSAEAQADVDIHAASLARQGGSWQATAPAPRVTRAALSDAFEPRQLVVTLGNTIQNEAAANALYATVVSVGGWAMASVADLRMGPDGPVRARKLNLSPFLNRSFLVKSPMVAYADGSHALPAYFEMGAAHGALVRLGADGRVRDMRRIAGPGKPIQPMIVPLDAERALAFLRDFDASGRLWLSRTTDGGQSWSAAQMTDIPNPSAPVAALAMSDGRILMAMNDDAQGADRLRLAVSADEGASWRVIRTLEDDGGDARYPMLRRLTGGEIALAYSHGTKRGIRAHVFNEAWVAAQ